MRVLVRADSIREVEKRIKAKEADGWKAITGVKLDDSEIAWNHVSYVCVMEKPDHPNVNKKRWGHNH